VGNLFWKNLFKILQDFFFCNCWLQILYWYLKVCKWLWSVSANIAYISQYFLFSSCFKFRPFLTSKNHPLQKGKYSVTQKLLQIFTLYKFNWGIFSSSDFDFFEICISFENFTSIKMAPIGTVSLMILPQTFQAFHTVSYDPSNHSIFTVPALPFIFFN